VNLSIEPTTKQTTPNLLPKTTNPLPAHVFWNTHVVIDPETGASLEYAQLKIGPNTEKWIQSTTNKIGGLAEGIQPHMPSGTETIHLIHLMENAKRSQSNILTHMCQLLLPKS
jgi:hypothetical protein